MKYMTNIVSTWLSNKVCILCHIAVLSGLHNPTSTGSSDACDTKMHEEHTGLWQCEAARIGGGGMFAKAVLVWCIMCSELETVKYTAVGNLES